MVGVFVGFSRIFLLGILIFKGLTARRLYESFGVKGLTARLLKPKSRQSQPLFHIHSIAFILNKFDLHTGIIRECAGFGRYYC
jgi:hypothetical protein